MLPYIIGSSKKAKLRLKEEIIEENLCLGSGKLSISYERNHQKIMIEYLRRKIEKQGESMARNELGKELNQKLEVFFVKMCSDNSDESEKNLHAGFRAGVKKKSSLILKEDDDLAKWAIEKGLAIDLDFDIPPL